VVIQGKTIIVSLTADEKHALTPWGIQRIDSFRQAEGGVSNRVLMLNTERGAFALRVYRAMPRERLDWEHRIIHHACAIGISTPLPIPTDTGASRAEWNGHQYALFPWLADEQLEREEISPQQAHAMGLFLADMEQRLAAFPLPHAPYQRLVALDARSRDEAASEVDALLGVIRALPHHGAHETLALSYLQGQQHWLRYCSRNSLSRHDYHLRLIHGDFHNNNLFFFQGSVSAIIDWERARIAPGGWDVVRALHLMLGLNPVLCRAFVKGYQGVASIDALELASTASLYGEEQDTNTWLLRVIYREGNERARRFLKSGEFHPFAEKWEELLPHLPL
jgi:Ser/Thr protein kinase RdoA (MazF antagonist)